MRRIPTSRGFTLIEIMTVIGIIAVLGTITAVAVTPALKKGRDAKRKAAIAQTGRFLTASACYMPDAGPGDYDVGELFGEITAKNPQVANYVKHPPRDPRGGTDAVTKFRYAVNASGDCTLYANLEYEKEKITLETLTDPTPGGGTGVLQGATVGVNGTTVYFQASN